MKLWDLKGETRTVHSKTSDEDAGFISDDQAPVFKDVERKCQKDRLDRKDWTWPKANTTLGDLVDAHLPYQGYVRVTLN